MGFKLENVMFDLLGCVCKVIVIKDEIMIVEGVGEVD